MRLTRLMLLLPLVSCTVGPDYHAPIPHAPAKWTEKWTDSKTSEPRTTELTAWWRRFRDPILDRLIDQAILANADVAQARAKICEARASYVQQNASLFPTVDSSGNVTRSRQNLGNQFGPAGTSASDYYYVGNSFQAGFDASFELDLFGGQRRSVESANAGFEATVADYGNTLLTLFGDVAHYYVEARGYQARIAVAKDTLASRRDTWRLTYAKAKAGTGTGLDEVQAKAAMESATTAIPPLEYDFRGSVNRLAVLTGQLPQVVLGWMSSPSPIPRLAGTIKPDPPMVALARRPDIQAAERRLASATADIGVAEADRLPAVTLVGFLGLNSTSIRSFANTSSNIWTLEPQYSVPIFDAGKRAAKVDEKTATRDEKLAAWEAMVRSAVEETENALVSLDRERVHNQALRRTIAAYAETVKVSKARYQAGLATFLDVLDADRSLAAQRDNLAQSDTALAVDAIALYKALGGGWQEQKESLAATNTTPVK